MFDAVGILYPVMSKMLVDLGNMEYGSWEYIPLSENRFYTIGPYSLQPNDVGVNCWLLSRESKLSDWKIFRVINT